MSILHFLTTKGCTDIKSYSRTSTFGYTFYLNGLYYDLSYMRVHCAGEWFVHLIDDYRLFDKDQKLTYAYNLSLLDDIEHFCNTSSRD